jgi:hypothetical protein
MENYEQASIDFLDNTGTTLMSYHKGMVSIFKKTNSQGTYSDANYLRAEILTLVVDEETGKFKII